MCGSSFLGHMYLNQVFGIGSSKGHLKLMSNIIKSQSFESCGTGKKFLADQWSGIDDLETKPQACSKGGIRSG